METVKIKPKIRYIRKKSVLRFNEKTGKPYHTEATPYGVLVAIDNKIGWSLCTRETYYTHGDKWNKELGLNIALTRAENYNGDDSKVPHSIREEYFKFKNYILSKK